MTVNAVECRYPIVVPQEHIVHLRIIRARCFAPGMADPGADLCDEAAAVAINRTGERHEL